MKKEKTVKTHTRKTKSGKTVTVRQHTAKYEAAEDIVKEALKKKKGAGDEFAARKKKEGEIPDLIHDDNSPWYEFENNFEEGWSGNPEVFCLANPDHHRKVANLAAYNLSKKYDGDNFFFRKDWEEIAQKAYNAAAKKLYPKEKLWSGDNEYNPEFHREFLNGKGTGMTDKQKQRDWEQMGFSGSYKDKPGKSSKKSPAKSSSSYDSMGFTKDEFKEWYEGTGSAADKKVEKALRKALGRKAYNELSDNAADNYRKGGASKFFEKNVSSAKPAEAPAKSKTTSAGADLKVGSSVKMGNSFNLGKGPKESFKVISTFEPNRNDRSTGLTQMAWVERKNGEVTLAYKDESGKWMYDDTWSDTGVTPTYKKHLKDAGYSLSKTKGERGEYLTAKKNESPYPKKYYSSDEKGRRQAERERAPITDKMLIEKGYKKYKAPGSAGYFYFKSKDGTEKGSYVVIGRFGTAETAIDPQVKKRWKEKISKLMGRKASGSKTSKKDSSAPSLTQLKEEGWSVVRPGARRVGGVNQAYLVSPDGKQMYKLSRAPKGSKGATVRLGASAKLMDTSSKVYDAWNKAAEDSSRKASEERRKTSYAKREAERKVRDKKVAEAAAERLKSGNLRKGEYKTKKSLVSQMKEKYEATKVYSVIERNGMLYKKNKKTGNVIFVGRPRQKNGIWYFDRTYPYRK